MTVKKKKKYSIEFKNDAVLLAKDIGIDEHGFNKDKMRGHRNFVTLIVDQNNSKPKELLPTRSKYEMIQMLSRIPSRENVKNISMDLSGTYRSFAKEFFTNAKIIANHFHVVRLLHPTINRMRKKLQVIKENTH